MAVTTIFFDFFGVIYHGGSINDELLSYISTLKPQYKLGMITSTREVERFVDKETLASLFDSIVASSETGLYKPDQAIFKLACQRLGCQPEQALLVDDLAENCAGARQAGLQAIQYTSLPALRDELTKLTVQ